MSLTKVVWHCVASPSLFYRPPTLLHSGTATIAINLILGIPCGPSSQLRLRLQGNSTLESIFPLSIATLQSRPRFCPLGNTTLPPNFSTVSALIPYTVLESADWIDRFAVHLNFFTRVILSLLRYFEFPWVSMVVVDNTEEAECYQTGLDGGKEVRRLEKQNLAI
jgi:hypothetical protein